MYCGRLSRNGRGTEEYIGNTTKTERIAIAIGLNSSGLGVRIQNPTIQYIRVFVRKRELYL
jgi:hypothetical protein